MREIYLNPEARSWIQPAFEACDGPNAAYEFHRQLPGYQVTPLVSLDGIAQELGLGRVLVKSDILRFGLPSFKILGASWGTFRALAQHLKLDDGITNTGKAPSFEALQDKLAQLKQPIKLIAATDGNHGRAVARMAHHILKNCEATIFVPYPGVDDATIDLIKAEGPKVIKYHGDYDEAVAAAAEEARKINGILIQDTSFEGYEDIPRYIVEGYSTMMQEIDQVLQDDIPDLVITPVGVGSLATAVVEHYSTASKQKTAVASVEPDTAACLWKALQTGQPAAIQTSYTIMAGMNCGTVSPIAWPTLRNGITTSVTVSDFQTHRELECLSSQAVDAGPCGAAALAALRRIVAEKKGELGLTSSSTVVLLCTEGQRAYQALPDISISDVVGLTQALTMIESTNPSLSKEAGTGEVNIARYIAAWLAHRDIEVNWIEDTLGRPSVVGVVRGNGSGKSIMLNGHIDTVTKASFGKNDPLSGTIVDVKMYGRGVQDMKAGVAANMVAIAKAKDAKLGGDVILAAVADEEDLSIGTLDVLRHGWRADAAIVSEPTDEVVTLGHKGFQWFEITFHGVAAHGSKRNLGTDAIVHAGLFLTALKDYDDYLNSADARSHPLIGQGSVHAGVIAGGEETSSYPAACTLTVERRSIPGEISNILNAEIEDILSRLASKHANFKYTLSSLADRPAFTISPEDAFVHSALRSIENATGQAPQTGAVSFWADSALLADKGIPTILYGVRGAGLHGIDEYAEVDSIARHSAAISAVVMDWCK